MTNNLPFALPRKFENIIFPNATNDTNKLNKKALPRKKWSQYFGEELLQHYMHKDGSGS